MRKKWKVSSSRLRTPEIVWGRKLRLRARGSPSIKRKSGSGTGSGTTNQARLGIQNAMKKFVSRDLVEISSENS